MMGNDKNAAIGALKGVGDERNCIWRRLLSCGLFAVALFSAGVVHAGDQKADAMETIEGSIWYRERIALPPNAEIQVSLEDVARMDVPAQVIASTRVEPKGGPPWTFSLPYDPEKLEDRGRYVVRVRIENDG
jgi:putative lipoprotein